MATDSRLLRQLALASDSKSQSKSIESQSLSSESATQSNQVQQNAQLQSISDTNNEPQTQSDSHSIDAIAIDTAAINDLDSVLEQHMEMASEQRQKASDVQLETEHREHNLLVFYVCIVIFALLVAVCVSNWGRTKLLSFVRRFGIDTLCVRLTSTINRYVPWFKSAVINGDDDIALSVFSSTSGNKNTTRRKLHMQDAMEAEKLIPKNTMETHRTKELFEPTLFGGESSILSTSSFRQLLHSWLPIHFNWLDWKLLYNLTEDGSSMLTLHDKIRDKGPLILVIKDAKGYIFGVFIAQADALQDEIGKQRKFFGGAETFVFTLYPNAKKYEWAGNNRFFVFFDGDSEHHAQNASITIGGGKSPALTLMNNLYKGFSEPCDTFNSPQLSATPQFDCIAFEVWGLIDYK